MFKLTGDTIFHCQCQKNQCIEVYVLGTYEIQILESTIHSSLASTTIKVGVTQHIGQNPFVKMNG